MPKLSLILKCKFREKIMINLPYEEIYFQRLEDEDSDKFKVMKFNKKEKSNF